MPPAILILAAGASSRMRGADKLLTLIDGQSLLRRVTTAALNSGCPVWVALPAFDIARRGQLDGLAVQPVLVADAAQGIAASLQAGIAAIPADQPVMLLLADLPDITSDDLRRMAVAHAETPDMILRATSDSGQPGHPVLFPPWLRAGLMGLAGDEGARRLLQDHSARVRAIALPGNHAVTDLDTPEDRARWLAGSEGQKNPRLV